MELYLNYRIKVILPAGGRRVVAWVRLSVHTPGATVDDVRRKVLQ